MPSANLPLTPAHLEFLQDRRSPGRERFLTETMSLQLCSICLYINNLTVASYWNRDPAARMPYECIACAQDRDRSSLFRTTLPNEDRPFLAHAFDPKSPARCLARSPLQRVE